MTSYRFPGKPSGLAVSGEYKPDYTIKQFSTKVYKVVRFKRSPFSAPSLLKLHPEDQQQNDHKLLNNFSRAKSMILQYALCNEWDYFMTGTIDSRYYDRYNLTRFYNALSQWVRDMRKKYGTKISFLFVPEHHKSGAWHIHGLLSGIPADKLRAFTAADHCPRKLIDGGYLNWPDYAKKFGFCSLGLIRDSVGCAYYITKYIDKELAGRADDLGQHLYFHSRPLHTAITAAHAYGSHPELDQHLQQHYDFCSVGMVESQSWSFPADYELCYDPLSVSGLDAPEPLAPSPCEEWEQMQLCFPSGVPAAGLK